MKTIRALLVRSVVLAGLLSAGLWAAHAVGAWAFTKRADTALLAEPNPLATAAVRLKIGSKLKVVEVQGSWLRVTGEKEAAGWIFAGNVGTEAPNEDAGMALVPLDASATTATAAARPLAPAAAEYGERRSLGNARADLDWLFASGAQVTTADVTAYLQANKKGEYQ